jgi:hypothetical protein
LIACCSKKAASAAPARALYQSDLFKKCSAYASQQEAPWFILSALHGLVDPNQILDPYDVSLNKIKADDRRAWSAYVTNQLRFTIARGDRVVFLAGRKYREGLIPWLLDMDCEISIPMEGMQIGEQLSFLKSQLTDQQ